MSLTANARWIHNMFTVSGIVCFNVYLRMSWTENIFADRNLVLQNVKSHVVSKTVRRKANRLRVLQDQKVLPEIQNGPPLLREAFSW